MVETPDNTSAPAKPQATQSSETPFVLRKRIYRAVRTPDLEAALTRCRHVQRAVYNRTIDAVAPEGGPVLALYKSPDHPDGLYGQLTDWRAGDEWLAECPIRLLRPAVLQARNALKAHEDSVAERCERLLEEDASWTRWKAAYPDWDEAAWDALPVAEKRKAINRGDAPPKSVSTWNDERAGDGSRDALHLRRKDTESRTVQWDTAPVRIDHSTLSLPGLGPIAVVANNPLPDAERLRSAQVCVRTGRRGRCRIEVHLCVRVDVVPRTKRPRKDPLVAGADMGCADTVTLHDRKTLTLPDHALAMGRAAHAQTRMNACVKGSRAWCDAHARKRSAHRVMRARDADAIAKFSHDLARRFDVVGLESLQVKTMTESARARGVADVEQVRKLNRRIRGACWGITQRALANAFEARGGRALKLPGAESSITCAECGHVDPKSRRRQRFRCTGCGHTAHADVNAARVMRARARRWLALRATTQTDAQAHVALREELDEARKQRRDTNRSGTEAIAKPPCPVREHHEEQDSGAGASS